MKENIQLLAKGRGGKILLEVLDEKMREVADVRTKMNVKPEFSNEVRLAVIEVLQSIADDVKVARNELTPPNVNEFV